MFNCNKIICGVSFCTILFIIYANALQYTLRRMHLPCSHRRPIHTLLLQQLALKKYYQDLMREKNNLENPFSKLEQAPFNKPELVPFNKPELVPFNTPELDSFNKLELSSYAQAQTNAQVKPVPNNAEEDANKALNCAKLLCSAEELGSAVCACNHVTGRVATFKDVCDLKRHNCRFDTEFKVILSEICPWEYQFRRLGGRSIIDYSDPKYYNNA